MLWNFVSWGFCLLFDWIGGVYREFDSVPFVRTWTKSSKKQICFRNATEFLSWAEGGTAVAARLANPLRRQWSIGRILYSPRTARTILSLNNFTRKTKILKCSVKIIPSNEIFLIVTIPQGNTRGIRGLRGFPFLVCVCAVIRTVQIVRLQLYFVRTPVYGRQCGPASSRGHPAATPRNPQCPAESFIGGRLRA